MKYSTKLYFALVSIVIITLFCGQLIIYESSKNLMLYSLRNKVKAIVGTSSLLIDGDLLKQIHKPQDANSVAYKTIQKELQELRHANRRSDLFVKYMFIVRPSEAYPNMIETVVDASVSPEPVSPIGELHNDIVLGNFQNHLNEIYSPSRFLHDNYGTWLIAFAPIYDSQGQYVATVGVNVSIIDVIHKLDELMMYVASALFIALLVAVIGAYFLSKRVTNSLKTLCQTVEDIGKGDLNSHAELETHDEFDKLGEAIDEMTKGLRERERMKSNFARYVSGHVMEKILKTETGPKLEGEKRKITVLFTDIRDFTRLAEKLPPDEVVGLLNEVFDIILPQIFAHFGTLDKFLGDGLMVEFGAPLDDEHQEKHAVEAAIDMHRALAALNKEREKQGKPTIEMGVGIHTGTAVVGYMGTEQRIEYTAVGDPIYVAAALEKATKNFKIPILISETTFSALKKEDYPFQDLGPLPISDRTNPITVYGLLSVDKPK